MLPVTVERHLPLVAREERSVLRPDENEKCDLEPENCEGRERRHAKRQQGIENQIRDRELSKRERGHLTDEEKDLEHSNRERGNQIAEALAMEKHERDERLEMVRE